MFWLWGKDEARASARIWQGWGKGGAGVEGGDADYGFGLGLRLR